MEPNLPQLFQQAIGFHRENRLTDAQPLYQEILRHAPQHGPTLFQLGTLYCQTQSWAGAAEALSRAAQSLPDNADVWNNLGTALRNCGRAPEATNAYARSLQTRDDALTRENLASLLFMMHQPL